MQGKTTQPGKKAGVLQADHGQTFFMSPSAEVSTRRTKHEIASNKIAAMIIEAQNIIQPAYSKPEGTGPDASLAPEAHTNDCLQADQPLAPVLQQSQRIYRALRLLSSLADIKERALIRKIWKRAANTGSAGVPRPQ